MMKHLVNVNNQQRAMSGINYRNGDKGQTDRQAAEAAPALALD